MLPKLEAVKRGNGETVLLRFAYTFQSRRHFSTGVIIPVAHYQPKLVTKPVSAKNLNSARLNKMVGMVHDNIMDVIAKLKREEKMPTGDYVFQRYHQIEVVDTEESRDPIISSLFQKFLDLKNYDESTLKLFNISFKYFKSCFGDIRVSEFDLARWTQFREYLFENKCITVDKSMSINTVCIRLKKLKTFLIYLRKHEKLEFPLKFFPVPKEVRKNISLDSESFMLVKEYQPTTDSMRNIKDLFMLQSRTGLRISDLTRLSKEHFIIGKVPHIYMKSYKTAKQMTIPLGKEALEIVTRHNLNLPAVVGQYYNRQIKVLLRLAGVNKLIEWPARVNGKKTIVKKKLCDVFTNHCCIRLAITYFFEEGYAPKQVADIVGKSLDTIMKYYVSRTSSDSILERHLKNITLEETKALQAA